MRDGFAQRCEHEMRGRKMRRREEWTLEMYPGIGMMHPILVGRHQDYAEEARRRRLIDAARAGTARHPRLTATRRAVGLALVGVGQRLAGTKDESAERAPVKPALRGVR